MILVRRFIFTVLLTAGLGFISSVQTAHAQQLRFIDDVVGQFNAMSARPDPLGFHIGQSPDPTTCKHYEGIARLEGADGTPYFVLTRSGLYVPPCFQTDDEPGSLTVVRMGSRDKNGERLRSNRLKRGVDLVDTASDANADIAVAHRRFNGVDGWPIYGHPESMQVLGKILVVGVDTPLKKVGDDWERDSNAAPMRVLFMNAADPEHLTIINQFVPSNPASFTNPDHATREINGGIVAITPQAGGKYLMMLTGASRSALPFDVFNEKVWFFESTSGDLTDQSLKWTLLDTWEANHCVPIIDADGTVNCPPNRSEDEQYAGQDWPVSKGREHQMFNFIRQGSINGQLYVAGARGGIDLVLGARIGEDILDLYRVDRIGTEFKLKLMSSRPKDSHPNADASVFATGESNFAAASGFYVSPSGELLFYATAHENGGPGGITTVGEWRDINIVRPDSPTLLPGVRVLPPAGADSFEVREGDSTVLAGLGEQPATKAWIQMWSDDSYRGRYIVVDFLDWSKDNFDDFSELEGSNFDAHFGFTDEASSWRWFAPAGTTIRANDNDMGADSPGTHTRTLAGTGSTQKHGNLHALSNDAGDATLGDELSSVQFLDDVAAYYTGRPDLFWDAGLDDSYATKGDIATFSAAELDGPRIITVKVKAVHPVDGQAGYSGARVRVVNVAPVITTLSVFNNLNQELGATVPFFVEGLPVTVRGEFTDPGKPDRQTSVINWGDGVSTASNSFVSFSDAFGGVKGELSDTRTYAGAGTFNLTLNVTDDDLDTSAQSIEVPVLTQEQALIEMIATLDDIIAATTDPALKKTLLDARKALQWVGASGALDKLALKNPQAALVKLGQALGSLRTAQAAGADVATLIALIEQVMASLQ